MKNPVTKNLIRSLCLLMCACIQLSAHAQVPKLNSYPSATAVIFLDFDGHTVKNTSWNSSGPIQCGPSGLDNAMITEIFNRVSEDYRPFNINITTDSTKFLAAPANRRMRVILTVTSSWYGNAGGVAFTGSFTWGDDSPCFVFTALLGYNLKFIGEAAAHEAGHTLGMYHQAYYDANCSKISDYYAGVGSGEIGWAPIMGVGYYKNFTLWNNGPNSWGCTNYQSDLDIITSATNGFGYRIDDHSNAFSNATLFTFISNQFDVNGVIERNTDNDYFKFTMPYAGRFELDAVPYNVGTGNSGSDLDLQITLYDESEAVLNIYNPGTLLSSIVDTALNAGIYYIKVEGRGNEYAPNYASLGSYSLVGKFEGGGTALPIRRLQLHGTQNGDLHSFDWIIDADETVAQQILEVSHDGRTFTSLTQTTKEARSYIYRPGSPATAQYRLQVSFDNGRRSYSNVVTLQEYSTSNRPKLVSNPITDNNIYINSPGNFTYTITDLNAKIIRTGLLSAGINHLDASAMSRGMYVVRFTGNDQQWTDKLLRQ